MTAKKAKSAPVTTPVTTPVTAPSRAHLDPDRPACIPGSTLYDRPVGETFVVEDEYQEEYDDEAGDGDGAKDTADTDTPDADDYVFPQVSRRAAGWSAANQRIFLEALAEGFGVENACYRVGLSVASAYAFRRSAKGAAFSLGWRAATLVARDSIAETLLVRALEGQVDTIIRADGSTVTRHRHDNRLGISLLARLDRQVEKTPDADVRAASLVAQEFDAFLDVLGQDASAARAGLFLARRAAPVEGEQDARDLTPIYSLAAADRFVRTGVATAAEVDIADLDPTARHQWTADQWLRAEAAGMVAVATPAPPPAPPLEPDAAPSTDKKTAPAPQHPQHSPDAQQASEPVWWDDEADEWRTHFPPPDTGLFGFESGEPDHIDYERALTDEEAALMGPDPYHYDAAEMGVQARSRDQWFAALAAARVEDAGTPDLGTPEPGAADAAASDVDSDALHNESYVARTG